MTVIPRNLPTCPSYIAPHRHTAYDGVSLLNLAGPLEAFRVVPLSVVHADIAGPTNARSSRRAE